MPPRTGTANLVILVNDINDHKPVFQQESYRAELSELLPVNSFVASMTAQDNDTGINAQITYSIQAGDSHGWFAIDSATGLVTTRAALDRETLSTLQLVVRAQDGAARSFSSDVDLTVVIFDENDETPAFSHSVYNVNVSEGDGPALLVTVSAVDDDQGSNGTIGYRFHSDVELDYPGVFSLHPQNGQLSCRIGFDREQRDRYELLVVAHDGGDPALSSTARVIISVTDVNDNDPLFYPTMYYVYIPANQPPTEVSWLMAQDADIGSNSALSFSILSGSTQKFSVDGATGVVSTRVPLLKSNGATYRLKVDVVDGGGRQAVAPAQLNIFILDDDDTRPTFGSQLYTSTLQEDNSRGAVQLNRAVGVDLTTSGFTDGPPVYSIVAGDRHGVFAINAATGQISSSQAVDRERQAFYSLTVVASTNSEFAQTTVEIDILDVNDNSPTFRESDVMAVIPENATAGWAVHWSMVEDRDSDDNARITYAISQNDADVFAIDEDSGLLTTAVPIRVSSRREFSVEILATDNGQPPLDARQRVAISVIDVNDITPSFSQLNHQVSLRENIEVNTQFYALDATDTDDDVNGALVYSVLSGNEANMFGIFPDGKLYVARQLDRERRDFYVLTIAATDQGATPRVAMTNVTIHVLDANDNAPVFQNSTYRFRLLENSVGGTFVGVVSAHDSDLNENSELTYQFELDSHGFVIDKRSGVIRSGDAATFDREALLDGTGQSELVLSVLAWDSGNVPLSSKCAVVVSLLDANDMTPTFSKRFYEVFVDEDLDVMTSVAQVAATDDDADENALIGYAIAAGNVNDTFGIDTASGLIRLLRGLDREVADSFWLTVTATDGGTPALSSSSTVFVRVQDVNDNVPVFIGSARDILVSEDAVMGQLVATLTASDADKDQNAALTFSIASGNRNDAFAVDARSGRLLLASSLDHESLSSYALRVTVQDAGSPVLSSEITLNITVTDVNDNAPVFSTSEIGEIVENTRLGTTVMTVSATDSDSDTQLRYSIDSQFPPGRSFRIDEASGVITTSAEIDREITATYTLTVAVADADVSETIRHVTTRDFTIVVYDVNDNEPVFTSQLAAYFRQDAQTNSRFAVVRAVDPDKDLNGTVQFSVDSDMFSIDAGSGSLYISSPVRTQLLYDVTVTATDIGTDGGSKSTTMTIFVQASEETGAEFTQPAYSARVTEGSQDLVVLTVTARYRDAAASAADLQYYITAVTAADGSDAPQLFSIHRNTGVIRMTEPLDREAGDGYSRFVITVHVVDRGSNVPRTRSVQVSAPPLI